MPDLADAPTADFAAAVAPAIAPAPGTAPASALQCYEVRRVDLPLSCPLPSMALWNAHPRVYLPIEAQCGEAACPYCGARFVLVD